MDTPDQLERGLQQAKEDLTLHLERLDDSGQEFLEDLMLLMVGRGVLGKECIAMHISMAAIIRSHLNVHYHGDADTLQSLDNEDLTRKILSCAREVHTGEDECASAYSFQLSAAEAHYKSVYRFSNVCLSNDISMHRWRVVFSERMLNDLFLHASNVIRQTGGARVVEWLLESGQIALECRHYFLMLGYKHIRSAGSMDNDLRSVQCLGENLAALLYTQRDPQDWLPSREPILDQLQTIQCRRVLNETSRRDIGSELEIAQCLASLKGSPMPNWDVTKALFSLSVDNQRNYTLDELALKNPRIKKGALQATPEHWAHCSPEPNAEYTNPFRDEPTVGRKPLIQLSESHYLSIAAGAGRASLIDEVAEQIGANTLQGDAFEQYFKKRLSESLGADGLVFGAIPGAGGDFGQVDAMVLATNTVMLFECKCASEYTKKYHGVKYSALWFAHRTLVKSQSQMLKIQAKMRKDEIVEIGNDIVEYPKLHFLRITVSFRDWDGANSPAWMAGLLFGFYNGALIEMHPHSNVADEINEHIKSVRDSVDTLVSMGEDGRRVLASTLLISANHAWEIISTISTAEELAVVLRRLATSNIPLSAILSRLKSG